MSVDPGLHRSFLYAPGSRPELMRKALKGRADAVILDLEDAVAPGAKDGARDEVAGVLRELADLPADRPAVHVRVNRATDGWDRDDLAAVVVPGLDGLRLPKAEDASHLVELAGLLDTLEAERGLPPGSVGLYPTLETALGASRLVPIVRSTPRVRRLAIGTSDLLADLGAEGDERLATLTIRSHLVVESRAAGVGPPVDSVHTQLDDQDGLRSAARWARSLGFWGKSVIHPRQVDPVHEVFTADPDQLAWAREVLAALERAERGGDGVATVGGEFVDEAVAARARAILTRRGTRT